jgi:hypothetical protein
MPKCVVSYSKTIIYKIVCNDLNVKNTYVGHTTNFTQRKKEHKRSTNLPSSNNHHFKLYQCIRDNGGWDNWSMIEIEKYPCNDKQEACARERHYFEFLNADLNMVYPTRSKKEYKIDNREKLLAEKKKYYETNKEKISEKGKAKMVCEICNCQIRCDKMPRHLLTATHYNNNLLQTSA